MQPVHNCDGSFVDKMNIFSVTNLQAPCTKHWPFPILIVQVVFTSEEQHIKLFGRMSEIRLFLNPVTSHQLYERIFHRSICTCQFSVNLKYCSPYVFWNCLKTLKYCIL